MNRYRLNNKRGTIGLFATKQDATNEMNNIIKDNNYGKDEYDNAWLTPFDFTLEKEDIGDMSLVINSYESAKKFLNTMQIKPNNVHALVALNKLITIAEAWNKADEFIPDFSNRNQYKWFPWFRYSDAAAGFVYADSDYTATDMYAYLGSCLCFKTEERAMQFGKHFISLWNKFLLNKKYNNNDNK